MINSGFGGPRRYREIDAGIVEHPLGVIRFGFHGLSAKAALAVWFIGTGSFAFQINSLIVEIVIALLAPPRGIAESFGGWDKYVR